MRGRQHEGVGLGEARDGLDVALHTNAGSGVEAAREQAAGAGGGQQPREHAGQQPRRKPVGAVAELVVDLAGVAVDQPAERALPPPAVAADAPGGVFDGLALGRVVIAQLAPHAGEPPPLQVDNLGQQGLDGAVVEAGKAVGAAASERRCHRLFVGPVLGGLAH